MPIKVQECYNALAKLHLPPEQYKNYKSMCDDHLSIAGLFLNEIPKKGTCNSTNAHFYIEEESRQMAKHLNRIDYNMFDISVPEHVYNEDQLEPEHQGIYTPAPGDVKFFLEALESHHPSIGNCMFGLKDGVPPQSFFDQMKIAEVEARRYRHE